MTRKKTEDEKRDLGSAQIASVVRKSEEYLFTKSGPFFLLIATQTHYMCTFIHHKHKYCWGILCFSPKAYIEIKRHLWQRRVLYHLLFSQKDRHAIAISKMTTATVRWWGTKYLLKETQKEWINFYSSAAATTALRSPRRLFFFFSSIQSFLKFIIIK